MRRLEILKGLVALAGLLTAGAAWAQPNTGTANFTRYVALGDSLTAGFHSGSIHVNAQRDSYPKLIFQQATGRTSGFEQPLVSEPGLPGVLRLASLVPGPVIVPTPGQGQPTNVNLPRPYDNMAVPGARLHDLLAKTQSTSASDPTDLILRRLGFTQLEQGLSLQPTFVTLWIGNNDVLGAATSGIVIDGVTLTPAAQFDAEFRAVAAAIASTGAKMAIANIPNVTSIPFVTTISRFVTVGGQTVTLVGPNGPLQAGDFVLLTASADIAQGRGIPGIGPPLGDNQVLSAAEVATIQDRINNFNATITAVANDRGAALIDSNGFLRELASPSGINVGGITYRAAFLTGGVFSYDGVHPTAFGYAFIANTFIEAINEKFDAAIPLVDLFEFVFTPKSAVAGNFDSPDFVLTAEAGKQIVDLFNQKPVKPRRPRRR